MFQCCSRDGGQRKKKDRSKVSPSTKVVQLTEGKKKQKTPHMNTHVLNNNNSGLNKMSQAVQALPNSSEIHCSPRIHSNSKPLTNNQSLKSQSNTY